MKNYKYGIFIFIASTLVGFLFITNLGGTVKKGVFNMKATEFKDATEERNKLLDEITYLKENNDELYKKINSYIADEGGSVRVVEDMKRQLEDYKPLNGNVQVSGPGIVLTIDDANYNVSENTAHEVQRSIFHDSDVALVLNELRSAGAEAIAMNSYRISNSTGVVCSWAFVTFNDEVMELAPFKFYVIGDPNYLEEALFAEGSHINQLLIRNLKVDVKKVDELILPTTSKIINPKFMERNEN